MDYQHIEQLRKQVEYERAMSPQVGKSHCLGMLHQNGTLESFGGPPMQPRNETNQPGLMGGLGGIVDRVAILQQALGVLEDKLTPLTGGSVPTACGNQAQQPEPAAIEEIARIILRLNWAVSTVESITNRVRI